MSRKESFNKLSYKRHENHFFDFMRGGAKENHANTWFEEDTVDAWRHARMYSSIDPLLKAFPEACWLTVGDGRYGKDAHYIQKKGLRVLATDISDALLKEGKEIGYIKDYRKENAEKLSFSDGEFDFVFCKESYHHFPRPMIALYEMLRVARKGVVLIEPNDRDAPSTSIEALFRSAKNLIRIILRRRNVKLFRHSFEAAGNYVYSVSRKEMEKVALGVNLGVVAYRGINDSYQEGVEYEKIEKNGELFCQIRKRINRSDRLSRLGLKPYDLLAVIIFKEDPEDVPIQYLIDEGYDVVVLPDNPYV